MINEEKPRQNNFIFHLLIQFNKIDFISLIFKNLIEFNYFSFCGSVKIAYKILVKIFLFAMYRRIITGF